MWVTMSEQQKFSIASQYFKTLLSRIFLSVIHCLQVLDMKSRKTLAKCNATVPMQMVWILRLIMKSTILWSVIHLHPRR